jgi:hypothetical protein
MLKGDEGLAAFLKDGSGYNKSGFKRQSKQQSSTQKDPLPWLKLPQFDFVDVAGQSNDKPSKLLQTTNNIGIDKKIISIMDSPSQDDNDNDDLIMQELEQLRLKLNREIQEENIEEADRIRNQLERLMKEKGIVYKPNDDARSDDFQ